MKKNWFRVTAAIAGFLAACVVVWAVSVATSAPPPADVNPAEVAEPAPVYLISDFRHPTPEPVVAEVVAPVDEGNSGGGYSEPEPAPYVPTCEDQGLYTVGGSCVDDLCYSYGDLDGDGVATDCLARYY